MVRSYVKYEQSHVFGTVTSALANTIWVQDAPSQGASTRTTGSGVATVGANEEVLQWNVKTGDLIGRWRDGGNTACVTAIARSHTDGDIFAAGYDDGSIRIWDSRTGLVIINFDGHKSAVTTLAFDEDGVRLASGAKDTDIIVWDLVGEVGLFKLRGHKDQLVSVHFLHAEADSEENGTTRDASSPSSFLVSASKDALLKLWDVEAQRCVETHIAQTNGECSGFGLFPDSTGCITAGADGEMKVWAIDIRSLESRIGKSKDSRCFIDRGVLRRDSLERITGISFDSKGNYFVVHGAEKAFEVWRVRSAAEVHKALARKARRRREKEKATGTANINGGGDINDEREWGPPDVAQAEVGDIFVRHVLVRTGGKVRSVDCAKSSTSKSLELLVATTNNMLETYTVPTRPRKGEDNDAFQATRLQSVDLPGHRADVRAMALSSDDRMLASASNGALKVWNVRTETCLRTLECGYALCCAFLPGDKIVLVGNKDGELQLFDIASSTLIESIKAHEGAIWTMQVHPDGRSVVTGSADKCAKFWTFAIVQENIPGTKRTSPRLRLQHARTLKVNDDILSVCFSPDERMLAVSTLDNTVKIFFTDSLKLFLNLYGHKLPVLSMSISSDSRLITTSSADKNVRIWGLDFGDCHKALFAHNDSIMAVRFIPQPTSIEDAHLFVSAGKDGVLKTWDGDKFEQVQKLDGHQGEIWAMTVSRTGDFLVTAGHDKSIRVWHQSDEPIFLEEEREREMEELYGATLTSSLEADGGATEGEDEQSNAVAASKQTVVTLTAGERIMEALEVGIEDFELLRDWKRRRQSNPSLAAPDRDPLFLALNGIAAERHVLNTIQRVPAAQLHDALLVLPFSALPTLFTFLGIWIHHRWNIALVCRVLFFMLKVHQRQIVGSRQLKVTLEAIRGDLRHCLEDTKHTMGLNYVALGFIDQRVQQGNTARLEDVNNLRRDHGRTKRMFVDVA